MDDDRGAEIGDKDIGYRLGWKLTESHSGVRRRQGRQRKRDGGANGVECRYSYLSGAAHKTMKTYFA